MIKDRLKSLDIKITELANYLSISRPTMYKFIELYDEGNKGELTNAICGLFDYIEEHELIDKKNVVSYILTNMSVLKGDNDKEESNSEIITYLKLNNDSEKIRFIKVFISDDDYDNVARYLLYIEKLKKKKKLTAPEKDAITKYEQIEQICNSLKEERKDV